MTTFCLIHSSGQGPEGWKFVVDELEKRGHRAITPAFDIDRTNEGAAWHAATMVDALDRSACKPADVVCVAHSAAGLYLPLIAESWRPRQMVFLAAIVPQPGVSAIDQFKVDPTMMNPEWSGKDPRDGRVAEEFIFHDCPPERLDWALSTCIYFYAKRAMEEPCSLTKWPDVPARYIVCTKDRTLTPEWQRRAARDQLRVEPIEIQSGHAPNVSCPEVLAETLVSICESQKIAGIRP